MRAMILAAGLGTRMRPLSALCAKPVLPVLNRPLLHWTLDALRRAGVSEAIVNLHHLPATVRAALGDGRGTGVRLSYSHERAILGTGGGPRRVRHRLGGRGPVLIVNGDMLFDFDLGALVRDHRASGAAVTLAVRRMPRGGRYAPVVVAKDGRVSWVRGVSGAPPRGRRTLFTGIHVIDPTLLERLPPGPSDSVRDLYAALIAECGPVVRAFAVEGAWYDLGTPRLYLRSQLELLRARFRGRRGGCAIHPAARVDGSASVRGAVVGAGCVVGPGARVERSVLWPGARVGAGAAVRGAILARGAVVAPGDRVSGVIQARAVAALRREPGVVVSGNQARFEGALQEA